MSIQSLDDYFASTPIGSYERALTNNLIGFNQDQIPGMLPTQKDSYGYTFFVRPQLNMNEMNLSHQISMYPLLSADPVSTQRYIRCMLDPRQVTGWRFHKMTIPALPCPIIDNQQAFIAPMTNNLISLSGWPDPVTPTFVSKPGLYGEVYIQVDGKSEDREKHTLTATYQNVKGDPILSMVQFWQLYQSYVFEGLLSPYPDFLIENTIDYNTRVFRFILDAQKEKVTKFASSGPAFITGSSLGDMFNFNREKNYLDQTREFSVSIDFIGAQYNHPRTVYDFNKSVGIFNPSMRDAVRDQYMVKLDKALYGVFRHRGYPRVNPDNYDFEWWVSRELFDAMTGRFLAANEDMTDYNSIPGD